MSPIRILDAFLHRGHNGPEEGSVPTDPTPDSVLDVRIDGPLDRRTVTDWHRRLSHRVASARAAEIRLDLAGVTAMDGAGAAFCQVLWQQAARSGGRIVLASASGAAREALAMFRVRTDEIGRARQQPGLFERLGNAGYEAREGALALAVLFTDTLYFTALGLFRRRINLRAVIDQMVRIGLESLGIVSLISLLVGLTVALQSAYQLRQFGANIFIANLVGVAMTREMGPLMTAILIAGRCGASIAAEISTMTITEEVDALKTMGIHPVRFLVVPRFLAITLTQPLLTVMSDALGILGGFVIAVTYLQLGVESFGNQLIQALVVKDLLTGLVKSVAFSWVIVFVGSHRGFQVRGGAEGVGIATTSAVVQAIFLVIVADAFFSLVFYFGG